MSERHHRHHHHSGNGELPWRQANDDPGRILDKHGNPIGWMWRAELAATVVACVNAAPKDSAVLVEPRCQQCGAPQAAVLILDPLAR